MKHHKEMDYLADRLEHELYLGNITTDIRHCEEEDLPLLVEILTKRINIMNKELQTTMTYIAQITGE